MKVLFTTIHTRYTQTSFALRYLKCNIKSEKIYSEIMEFNINQDIEVIFKEILKKNFQVICFSVYIWNIDIIKSLSKAIKSVYPKITIIYGGPEVSGECESLLKKQYADIICKGEFDLLIESVLTNINNPKNLRKIPGVNFIYNQKLVLQDIYFENKLNKIESPLSAGIDDKEKTFIYLETNRGCPFNCEYCLSGISGPVRYFPEKTILNDIKTAIDNDYKTIRFIDRTFNLDEKRSINIMKFILHNRKEGQLFQFEIKGDLISSEFLSFLERVPENTFQFEIGVQTVNQRITDLCNRVQNTKKLLNNIKYLKEKTDILLHIDLIIGLKGESSDSFKENINIFCNIFPDKLQINTLKVLKGSDFFNNSEKYGLKFWKTAPYEIISNSYMSVEEIYHFHDISRLIEIFYNNDNFTNTFKNIFIKINPYDFYTVMRKHFLDNNISFHSISRKKQYKIMINILEEYYMQDYKEILEYIKLDFILSNIDPKNNSFDKILLSEKKDLDLKNNVKDNKTQYNIREKTRLKISKNLFEVNFNINNFEFYYFDHQIGKNIFIEQKEIIEVIKFIKNNKNVNFSDLISNIGLNEIKLNNIIFTLIQKKIIKKI